MLQPSKDEEVVRKVVSREGEAEGKEPSCHCRLSRRDLCECAGVTGDALADTASGDEPLHESVYHDHFNCSD
jgi:hypothetical protein